jgi:hypothetical protein
VTYVRLAFAWLLRFTGLWLLEWGIKLNGDKQ